MCITWLYETRQVPTISEHRGWIMFKRFMLGIWWAVKAKHIVAFNLIHHRCWDMSSSIQGLMVPLPLGSCTDSWLNLFGWLHILRSALTLRAQFSPNGLSSASAWVITLQPPLRKVFFSTWQRIASSLECFMFRDLSDKRDKLNLWSMKASTSLSSLLFNRSCTQGIMFWKCFLAPQEYFLGLSFVPVEHLMVFNRVLLQGLFFFYWMHLFFAFWLSSIVYLYFSNASTGETTLIAKPIPLSIM